MAITEKNTNISTSIYIIIQQKEKKNCNVLLNLLYVSSFYANISKII